MDTDEQYGPIPAQCYRASWCRLPNMHREDCQPKGNNWRAWLEEADDFREEARDLTAARP